MKALMRLQLGSAWKTLWRTRGEKKVPEPGIKLSFNTFNNRLSVQSQPNYMAGLFVFPSFIFPLRLPLWKNKHVWQFSQNTAITVGEPCKRQPSKRNVMCTILSPLNCSLSCARGCIKKASIYTLCISLITFSASDWPSRLGARTGHVTYPIFTLDLTDYTLYQVWSGKIKCINLLKIKDNYNIQSLHHASINDAWATFTN